MLIRLLVDLPVEKRHGLTAGLVMPATLNTGKKAPYWWVKSPITKERVGVMFREAEVVEC